MKETYFVIRNSDGDTTDRAYSKEELLREIEMGEFGRMISHLPNDPDTNYWGEDILIIKGKIVVPTEEKVVTKYNIE